MCSDGCDESCKLAACVCWGLSSLARAADGSTVLLAWTADGKSTIKSLECMVNNKTRSKVNGQGVWSLAPGGQQLSLACLRTRLRKSFHRLEKPHHHAFSTLNSLETHRSRENRLPAPGRLRKCSHMHASTLMLSQTHSFVSSRFCRSSSSLELAEPAPFCSQPANLLDVGV